MKIKKIVKEFVDSLVEEEEEVLINSAVIDEIMKIYKIPRKMRLQLWEEIENELQEKGFYYVKDIGFSELWKRG